MPEIADLQDLYDSQLAESQAYIKQQLEEQIFPDLLTAPEAKSVSWLSNLFGSKRKPAKSAAWSDPKELSALAYWQSELEKTDQPENKHCLFALIKVVNALFANRGRAGNDLDMIMLLTVNYVSNPIGAEVVSQWITPRFDVAAEQEGFRKLPLQKKPVVMNVKGASASGKSTIRPQQQQLADKLGIAWQDFALISPDYWRKYPVSYTHLTLPTIYSV